MLARGVIVAAIAALLAPAQARSALYAVFSERSTEPGERVELRMVGRVLVPAPSRHAAIDVYLVENRIADSVRPAARGFGAIRLRRRSYR
jgi:hypothetical protein